jgi:hypothetical protein
VVVKLIVGNSLGWKKVMAGTQIQSSTGRCLSPAHILIVLESSVERNRQNAGAHAVPAKQCRANSLIGQRAILGLQEKRALSL